MTGPLKESYSEERHPVPQVRELQFSDFVENEHLGLGIPVAVIVKDQDRLMRAKRLVDTYTDQKGFSGRSQVHDLQNGFIYVTPLTSVLEVPDKSVAYLEFPEPRNIAKIGNSVVITAGDALHIFTTGLSGRDIVKNPYFGCLHSAKANKDSTKMVVCSTGFDSILEFDNRTRQELWRWTAWDHGYNLGANGSFVTEDKNLATAIRDEGKSVLLLDESVKRPGYGIPTAYRTTHVNEVTYDYDENFLLATFFHTGEIVRIQKETGISEILMSGMSHPHAIEKYKGGYIVTDTSHGLWYQLDQNFRIMVRVDFRGFPGKEKNMENIEWIQSVMPLTQELFVAVDANRQSLWIFDPVQKQYNRIKTKPEWAVQVVLPVDTEYIAAIQKRE